MSRDYRTTLDLPAAKVSLNIYGDQGDETVQFVVAGYAERAQSSATLYLEYNELLDLARLATEAADELAARRAA